MLKPGDSLKKRGVSQTNQKAATRVEVVGLIILNHHRNRVWEWQDTPRLSQGQRRKGEMKDFGVLLYRNVLTNTAHGTGRLVNISFIKSGSSLRQGCIKSEIIYVWKNLCPPPCRDQGCLLCSDILFMFERKYTTSANFFDLKFFYKPYLQLPFLSSEMVQALAHPCFYQIGISFPWSPPKARNVHTPILPGF